MRATSLNSPIRDQTKPRDDGAEQMAIKSLASWDTDHYLNIFVVPEIAGNDGDDGTQAYAYLGPTGNALDGVVILSNAFGTVGMLKPGRILNRTLTHEVGHYFGLLHTFHHTDECGVERNCESFGDQVCDTPPTPPNYVCASPSCESAAFSNYMDYTQETCKNSFTEGQCIRMRGMRDNGRSSLQESFGAIPVVEKDITIAGITGIPDVTCIAETQGQVQVLNQGTTAVQGFRLTATLNQGPEMVISSNVAVQPNEIVSVPISFGSALRGTNTLAVHIAQTNGEPDDYPDNDESLTNFTLEQTDFFTLTVQSDHWANEFEWSLKDDRGETLMGSP